jgi:hypothetical protein
MTMVISVVISGGTEDDHRIKEQAKSAHAADLPPD